MNRLPNIHPGEILRAGKISQTHGLEPGTVGLAGTASDHKQIGRCPCFSPVFLTADTALRFSRAFGTTPGFWLGLQADYDTEEAEKNAGESLARITPLAA